MRTVRDNCLFRTIFFENDGWYFCNFIFFAGYIWLQAPEAVHQVFILKNF